LRYTSKFWRNDLSSKQIALASDKNPATPSRAWLVGLSAWAVPGAGHFLAGRWLRGLLLGGAVWGMFIIGFLFNGHLFAPTGEQGAVALMSVPPMIADFGCGLPYLFCWVANMGFAENARSVTYEYGNTFLMVAGLLNYLLALDAFDIAAGRKD
jgi:hypothetical protein